MVTKVLCVAEKPSIAKAVAGHLSGGSSRVSNTRTPWLKNYSFSYNFPTWGPCEVVMTSVAGHLQSTDFAADFKNWRSCDPERLFEAPLITYVQDDKKGISANIETQARNVQILFIWTDCDREGEHIGSEIREVALISLPMCSPSRSQSVQMKRIWTDCDREGEHIGSEIREVALNSNPRLRQPGKVVRARFSNIERAHIIQAARNPIPLDENSANAVAARIELDLRIGASFTRWQTLEIFEYLKARGVFSPDEKKILSYGGCQFPTLGFVVDRYFMVKNFVPEPYWAIKVTHIKDDITVNFRWARINLFDRMAVIIIFERCLTARYAKVINVQTKPASKWKPLPLTTVELQKMGSRFLRMDSSRVMKIAEDLYTRGFISYPRTETDQFDKGMDLRALVQKQTQSQAWGPFAQNLMNGGFNQPRQGRNNDKAHPPIHPVNFVTPNALNNQDERKVYEFVVRRFLACCSEDAKGSRDEVGILYGTEMFNASGLSVLARNYLDVYPYDKWTSTQQLPQFQVGETFEPTEARMTEGKTSPPGYLTEPDLIALMDANGIGTDATMAEHIVKVKEREYVMTRPRTQRAPAEGEDGREEGEAPPVQEDDDDGGGRGGGRGRGRGRGRGGRGGRGGGAGGRGGGQQGGVQEFIPTTLGVALVKGYEDMGFDTNLSKPFLRKEMEIKMKEICAGTKTKGDVVHESLDMYRDVYIRTRRGINILKASVDRYVPGAGGNR